MKKIELQKEVPGKIILYDLKLTNKYSTIMDATQKTDILEALKAFVYRPYLLEKIIYKLKNLKNYIYYK